MISPGAHRHTCTHMCAYTHAPIHTPNTKCMKSYAKSREQNWLHVGSFGADTNPFTGRTDTYVDYCRKLVTDRYTHTHMQVSRPTCKLGHTYLPNMASVEWEEEGTWLRRD